MLTPFVCFSQGPFSHDEDSQIDPDWDYRLDFSSCFEDVILANIPVAFILAVGLTRAILIRNQPLAPHRTSANYELKQFLLVLLAVGMLAEAGVAMYEETYDYRVLTPAVQAVGYVSTWGLACLSALAEPNRLPHMVEPMMVTVR